VKQYGGYHVLQCLTYGLKDVPGETTILAKRVPMLNHR